MKFLRFSLLFASVIALCLITSCDKGGGSEPSIEETNLKLMTGGKTPKVWTISEVRLNNTSDKTDDFTGMELSISGNFDATANEYNYTMSNRPALSPWPGSGTWSFSTVEPENLIIRNNDDLEMEYTVTDTQLVLSFTYSGAGFAGRTNVVEGFWQFKFTSN